ncbi:Fcs-like zinc finger [Thalictrum thalictroides]|nr:Fcs-like zinc finger [Thalictrum thalictroides]
MSDSASDSNFQNENLGQKQKSSSFFSVPGLFVGFSIKGASDSDSVRSPTSPLDYKVVTNLGNPRSGPNGSHKSWNSSKVGLGIVDSLDDVKKPSENAVGLSGSGGILFGSQMRMNIPFSQSRLYRSIDSCAEPKSLPKDYTILPQTRNISPHLQLCGSKSSDTAEEMQFEPKPHEKFRSYLSDSSSSMSRLTSLVYCNHNSSSEDFWSEKNTKPSSSLIHEDSNIDNSLGMKPSSLPISIASASELVGSLSAREIALSEDYTCIISHGPNPRTTHIFGDCILECHTNELANSEEQRIGSPLAVMCSDGSLTYPLNDFLSFCYFCKKKLEQGKDIYMYRGEKAFCSCACRDQEILVEEGMEKPVNNSSSSSPRSTCSDDIFLMI